MKTITANHLDPYWEGLARRVERLKRLDLTVEADLEEALDESQRLLGAIAHCRHLLGQVEPHPDEQPHRRAA